MLWVKNKLCHDNTAWWDSKSWNSEKPSTASPRSLRVKRMNPRSSLQDWPNPAQKWSGCREGKLQTREHETLQLSLHPFHQYCYACVKESMTTPNDPIPFCMLILPEQSRRVSHPKKSSSAFDALGSSCCWVDVCTWLVPDSLSGGFGACPAAEFAAANGSLTFL